MPSDFDVAIAGSVPLIDDFDDVDPTLAPINTLGRRSEIRMRLECILQCLARLDSKEFTPLHGLFLRPRTYPTTSLNKGRVCIRSATASAHLPPKYPSCRGVTQDFATDTSRTLSMHILSMLTGRQGAD